MTSNFYTPLRYPGGKGKLADYIKAVLTENNLVGGHYVEPYAGGAAVAMELLILNFVDEIHINDLNRGVYSFWRSVLDRTDEIVALIENTPVTMDEWLRQKKIQAKSRPTILELGFSTFFLNRCNRSGILKAGVIGGKKQDGKWKIDARYNKSDLVSRIRAIAEMRDQITLYRKDAVELISSLSSYLPKKTLYYLDPPYYVKGKGLYDNFYDHADHAAVATAVKNINKGSWLVSYDDVAPIKDLYVGIPQLRYTLSYSAQSKGQGGEIMFFGPKVSVPAIPESVPMRLAA
ncbi:DNA adenine methylase [Achromobacter sp. E1]|uniref:DNA adenine methylase n=1 Tax=Achromobacter sp. E1 TaxID=3141581 RepID=UPI0030CBB174